MNKATKVAVEKYPHGTFDGELGDSLRAACAVGYMQAEKDYIELAELWVGSGDAEIVSFKQFLKCHETQSNK